MSETFKLIVSALFGGSLSAFFAYLYTRRLEEQKIERRRVAVGTVIQAELATLYRELSDHEAKMDSYLKRITNAIGSTTKADFPKMEIGDGFFSVYQSTIPEIGLFRADPRSLDL